MRQYNFKLAAFGLNLKGGEFLPPFCRDRFSVWRTGKTQYRGFVIRKAKIRNVSSPSSIQGLASWQKGSVAKSGAFCFKPRALVVESTWTLPSRLSLGFGSPQQHRSGVRTPPYTSAKTWAEETSPVIIFVFTLQTRLPALAPIQ